MRPAARPILVGLALGAIFLLHSALPVGPSAWHWAHLLAFELSYVPILAAAAWFRLRGTVLTILAASVLSGFHDAVAWRGFGLLQQAHAAQILTFWIAGILAWRLFEQRRLAHAETLKVMARSLELRERYTEGHSERVRSYTLAIAHQMGIRDPATLETYAVGAFLHDIGKIGISDAILLKEGPLTPEEWKAMRTHPALGAGLISPIAFLSGAKDLVLSHHERFDGKGYPAGAAGAQIPQGARIFAVADAFDALTTRCAYHTPQTYTEAAQAIAQDSGTQFDPVVVEAFLAIPFDTWAATAAALGVTLQRG